MLQELMGRYLEAIDLNMREIVNAAPVETPGYGVMLRYPFGWVDEHGNSYDKSTGKRIRPILLLLCTEAAGGDWHNALPAASAVEILHNFSLIHDDIQDNSPVRHNRPTLGKFGESPTGSMPEMPCSPCHLSHLANWPNAVFQPKSFYNVCVSLAIWR